MVHVREIVGFEYEDEDTSKSHESDYDNLDPAQCILNGDTTFQPSSMNYGNHYYQTGSTHALSEVGGLN